MGGSSNKGTESIKKTKPCGSSLTQMVEESGQELGGSQGYNCGK
jgi:hypothetical protein